MIDEYLEKLHGEGVTNDSSVDSRDKMMFNITPTTGRFLELLILDSHPKRILEIGSSNGYSTIWMARAASAVQATIDSIDISIQKTRQAETNLRACRLLEQVTLQTIDADEFLNQCPPDRYDFVFLDSDRSQYVQWAPAIFSALRVGTLVVDNAISHSDAIAEFRTVIDEQRQLESVVLPIGKGQLVVRARDRTKS